MTRTQKFSRALTRSAIEAAGRYDSVGSLLIDSSADFDESLYAGKIFSKVFPTSKGSSSCGSGFRYITRKLIGVPKSIPSGEVGRLRIVSTGGQQPVYLTTIQPRSANRNRANRRVLDSMLRRLQGLQDGWDGADAPAPSELAYDIALGVLDTCEELGILITSIVPSAEGGIGLTFRSFHRRASLEIFNDGSHAALIDDGADRISSWEDTSRVRLPKTLHRLGEFLDS